MKKGHGQMILMMTTSTTVTAAAAKPTAVSHWTLSERRSTYGAMDWEPSLESGDLSLFRNRCEEGEKDKQ